MQTKNKARSIINWVINPVSVLAAVALCHALSGHLTLPDLQSRPEPMALLKGGARSSAQLLEVSSRIENGRIVRVMAAVDGNDRIQKIVFTGLGEDQVFSLEQLRQGTPVASPPGMIAGTGGEFATLTAPQFDAEFGGGLEIRFPGTIERGNFSLMRLDVRKVSGHWVAYSTDDTGAHTASSGDLDSRATRID
jgi:hypothetical protein